MPNIKKDTVRSPKTDYVLALGRMWGAFRNSEAGVALRMAAEDKKKRDKKGRT